MNVSTVTSHDGTTLVLIQVDDTVTAGFIGDDAWNVLSFDDACSLWRACESVDGFTIDILENDA